MKHIKLLEEIRKCTHCQDLPLGPKPVLNFSNSSRVLIAGQAPGTKVHESGIPWNDASGVRLREWLGIDSDLFYNPKYFAIVPMGFCYPGKGKTGDLPPRKECSELWHKQILEALPNLELVIAIGKYAQDYYLNKPSKNLTENVKSWDQFHFESHGKSIKTIVLPHPSPRNNIWLKKNPWFEEEIIPKLKKEIKTLCLETH